VSDCGPLVTNKMWDPCCRETICCQHMHDHTTIPYLPRFSGQRRSCLHLRIGTCSRGLLLLQLLLLLRCGWWQPLEGGTLEQGRMLWRLQQLLPCLPAIRCCRPPGLLCWRCDIPCTAAARGRPRSGLRRAPAGAASRHAGRWSRCCGSARRRRRSSWRACADNSPRMTSVEHTAVGAVCHSYQHHVNTLAQMLFCVRQAKQARVIPADWGAGARARDGVRNPPLPELPPLASVSLTPSQRRRPQDMCRSSWASAGCVSAAVEQQSCSRCSEASERCQWQAAVAAHSTQLIH
jgi:hypothetical protein